MAYLKHHGVKGQKWGVRRTPEELARARGEIIRRKKQNQHAYEVAKRFRNGNETEEDRAYVREIGDRAGKHLEKYDKLDKEFKSQNKYKTFAEFMYHKNPDMKTYIHQYQADEEKYMDNIHDILKSELGDLQCSDVNYSYKSGFKTVQATKKALDILDQFVLTETYPRIKNVSEPAGALEAYYYDAYIDSLKKGTYPYVENYRDR